MSATKRQAAAKPKRGSKATSPIALNRPDPTRREAEAIEVARKKYNETLTEPVEVSIAGGSVDSPHNQPEGFTAMLGGALGSRSADWAVRSVNHLASAVKPSADAVDQAALNSALAFMSAVDPQNAVEAAIGMQMLAAHEAALDMTRRARKSDMLDQLEAFGSLATKFSRTFAVQVEALAKLRRKGEQVVKHVHVHEGGQAVVAGTINQHQGGGGNARSTEQSHGTGAAAECASLRSPDPARDGMPLASYEERAVSPPRRA